MLARSLEAAEQLAGQGISARVVEDAHCQAARRRGRRALRRRRPGRVVTAEEHSIVGGLGGAVAEVLSERHPVPLKRVGIADRFAETGPYTALLDRYGMAVQDIVAAAGHVVRMKSGSRRTFA